MIHVALDRSLAVQKQYKVNDCHLHVTFDVLVYSRTPSLPKPVRIEGHVRSVLYILYQLAISGSPD